MREVKINRVPFDSSGNNEPVKNTKRIPFNPNNTISEGFNPVAYNEGYDEIETTLDFIQKNSLRTMRDDEKEILRDMINNPNTKKDDLSDAIVTLQGKKAKQIGNSWLTPDYYMDKNEEGVYKPVALQQGEKIPQGKDVANTWGTKASAKDDAWYTDIAKTAFNIIPGIIGGVEDLAQLGTQLATGEESDWLREAQTATEALKFNKDEDIEGPIYNFQGIKSFSDILDSKRVDLSPETIWGTVLSIGGFLGEMAIPAGIFSKAAKAYKLGKAITMGLGEVEDISKVAKFGSVMAGTFLSTLGDTQDASASAGITGRTKGVVDFGLTVVTSAIASAFGVEGKLLTNTLAQDAKKGILNNVVKGLVKDAEGNITKESMEFATKELVRAYTPVVSSFAKRFGKDTGEEIASEVAEDFANRAGQQVFDKLSLEDQGRFGVDAFSAESFGSYINSAGTSLIGGGALSGISAMQKGKAEQQEIHQAQSSDAFKAVNDGAEAVKALKTNLNNSFEKGEITKDDLDHAMLKINAYNKYHQTAKDLVLDDKGKKELSELAFQKENLEASIKSVEDKDTKGHSRLNELNPLELGQHNSKMAQAKELQKKIDLLVTKSEILVQPEVAEKIVDNVAKSEEKEVEKGKKETEAKPKESTENNSKLKQNGYVYVPKNERPVEPRLTTKQTARWQDDKRTYNEIPKVDLSNTKMNARIVNKVYRKLLDTKINNQMEGTLDLSPFEYDKKDNRTIVVNLEDGVTIKTASSMRRDAGFSGHFQTEHLKGDVVGNPVVIKSIDLNNPDGKLEKGTYKSGKKVIAIYQKSDGKFLSFMKETNIGSKEAKDKNGNPLYNESENDINQNIINSILKEDGSLEFPEGANIKPATPINEADKELYAEAERNQIDKKKVQAENNAKKVSIPLTITKQTRQQLYDLGLSKVNVDNMSPEKALEIINKQDKKPSVNQASDKKAEIEPAKIVDKKEQPLKEKQVKEVEDKQVIEKANLSILNKISYYNNELNKKDKKGDLGRELYNKINKEVADIGGEIFLIGKKGKIKAKNKEGVSIVKKGTKRKQGVIDDEKYKSNKRKNALNTVPTSPQQYIAMVVGRGGRFDKSITKEQTDVPSLYKDEERGFSLESLYNDYKEESNLDNISESEFNSIVENTIKDYFQDNGRLDAIKFAEESYEKEINGGVTDAELNERAKYEESLSLTPKEGEVITEVVDNLNEQEIDKLNQDLKNGKEKRTANEIAADVIGEKAGTNNPFNETEGEGERGEEGKDIISDNTDFEPFQKVSSRKGDITKVVEAIRKAFKGITVTEKSEEFNNTTIAGKVSGDGKTLYVNPNYAGLDTPIHEAGHILIDAIGYNNKVIQAAIKQLRGTDLYTETKERYKELSEQELDKEALAEAIGREGADIFTETSDKSKFKQYLDYIYDWLKTKLGMNKNIAKSLAKQIISGIGTKNLTGTENRVDGKLKDQLQKLSEGKKLLTFNEFKSELGVDVSDEKDMLKRAYASLDDKDATTDEVETAKEVIELHKIDKKMYAKEYRKYVKPYLEDLSEYNTEELQDLYSQVSNLGLKNIIKGGDLKLDIALRLRQAREEEIKKIDPNYLISVANKTDIKPLDVWLKNVSHFDQNQPEMQALAKKYQSSVIDMLDDASTVKSRHEQLATKVIKEENNRIGIFGKAASLISSDSVKYFDWMENKGKLLTADQAKGLSKVKRDYLDFYREELSKRRTLMTSDNYANADMDVIRVDKRFMESYKQDGIVSAISYYLGGGTTNLGEVRIMYNGKAESFKNIESDILSKVDRKNPASVLKAIIDLIKNNYMARKQLKKNMNVDEVDNPLKVLGNGKYSINNNGILVSKFDKKRNGNRGYSKDFYRAFNEFIDDTTHVKHMNPLMPAIHAVEYLANNGYDTGGIDKKPNLEKWIVEWKKLHIFKETYVNDPALDSAIKFLRGLTASTTMWFNLPAGAVNLFVGNYNSWRQENKETILLGNKRMFFEKGERAAKGVLNKYSLAILEKYHIVNHDYDSNPKIGLSKIFEEAATFLTRAGEYQIQGSLALGLMEDYYNKFEFKTDKYGNSVLVVKSGENETEIKEKMIAVKNRVTDIQGKYPDADRRNIMRGEIGKAAFQFKVWMPDWFKERFSAKYINSYNQVRQGSFNAVMGEGFKQIKNDLKSGDFNALYKNKAFMSNLKGLAVMTALAIFVYKNDDDEEKRKRASLAENSLGQVLFLLDLNQVKYTLSNPVAALGKAKDLVNVSQDLLNLEIDEKNMKRILPANKLEKVSEMVSDVIE